MNHKQDIIEAVALSAHALNTMNIDLYRRLWAQEASWEIGAPLNFKFKGTREELAGAFEMGMKKRWKSYFQLVHSTVVELTSETTAKAVSYLTEQGETADGQGQSLVGSYEDELVLTPQGWAFTSRKFKYLYYEQKKLGGQSSLIGQFLK